MSLRSMLVVAAASLGAACQAVQTTQPGVIGLQRKQAMMFSEAQVEREAQEAYRRQLEQARDNQTLNADPISYERVQRILQRLIPHTGVFRPEAPQWRWEANVRATADINAYCLPGGKMMIYQGMIDELALTDAELAAIVGHEMAHALRQHMRERLSHQVTEQLALSGLALASGAEEALVDLAGEIIKLTLTLPHNRRQELEADQLGVELMARAGYDPQAALQLWRKMAALGGERAQLLSTHPSSERRIRKLEHSLPLVSPLYEQAVAATALQTR